MFSGSELTTDTVEKIEGASQAGTLFLSAISAWEIGMLLSKNRIALSMELEDWIERAFNHEGVQTLAPNPTMLARSSFLPGRLHGDPADRIIIATARAEGLTILTRDRLILDYAAEGYVAALPC